MTIACRFGAAGLFGLALASGLTPAFGQSGAHPWIDQSILPAAKAEGSMIIYSSTNEQEGLPLWKVFEDATGIKVQYVRAADSPLMSRVAIEFRGGQKAWDIIQTTTLNKMPPQTLAQVDLSEAKNLIPEARDPGRRWYGLYANYNSPAYNTNLVKAADLPKTYEEFAKHPEWAGRVAIDGTDNEWLKAIFEFYGEEKATQSHQRHRGDLEAGHHRRPPGDGARDGRRRVCHLAQQLHEPIEQREARRRPDRGLRA